jgi:hypothetical protein
MEIVDMATLYVQKEQINTNKYENWLKNFSSTWVWSTKAPDEVKDDGPVTIVRDWRIIVLNSNKSTNGK